METQHSGTGRRLSPGSMQTCKAQEQARRTHAPPQTHSLRVTKPSGINQPAQDAPFCLSSSLSPSVLARGGQSSRQMSLIIFPGVGGLLDSSINQRPITPTAGWVAIVLFLTYHRKIRLSVTTETPFESQQSRRMGLLLFYYFYLSS